MTIKLDFNVELISQAILKRFKERTMSNYYEPKKHDSMYLGGEEDWQQLWPKMQELPSEKLFRTVNGVTYGSASIGNAPKTLAEQIKESVFTKDSTFTVQAKPAIERQVGGSHYKDKGSSMQPWAIIDAWELDFYGGNVLKYLLRAKHKGGLEDLQKARHYLDKMIEDADDQ